MLSISLNQLLIIFTVVFHNGTTRLLRPFPWIFTDAIRSSGAIAYTMDRAREASAGAIEALAKVPDNEYKDSLIRLAHFAVDRRY